MSIEHDLYQYFEFWASFVIRSGASRMFHMDIVRGVYSVLFSVGSDTLTFVKVIRTRTTVCTELFLNGTEI